MEEVVAYLLRRFSSPATGRPPTKAAAVGAGSGKWDAMLLMTCSEQKQPKCDVTPCNPCTHILGGLKKLSKLLGCGSSVDGADRWVAGGN